MSKQNEIDVFSNKCFSKELLNDLKYDCVEQNLLINYIKVLLKNEQFSIFSLMMSYDKLLNDYRTQKSGYHLKDHQIILDEIYKGSPGKTRDYISNPKLLFACIEDNEFNQRLDEFIEYLSDQNK